MFQNTFYIIHRHITHDQSKKCYNYEFEQEPKKSIFSFFDYFKIPNICPKCGMFLYGLEHVSINHLYILDNHSRFQVNYFFQFMHESSFTKRFDRQNFYFEVNDETLKKMKETLENIDVNILPISDKKGYYNLKNCYNWLKNNLEDENIHIIGSNKYYKD
jgi:hypothetical protein